MVDVSRNTMSFAIPEELRGYVDERVQSGEYGNTSEYLRDLIRQDRREQAAARLRALVADGLESGEGRVLDDERTSELRDLAVGSGE
jgi:antitoxin ParD1/3/4